MIKMEKWRGKVNFKQICDVRFLNCEHLDQKEIYKITLHVQVYTENKKLQKKKG